MDQSYTCAISAIRLGFPEFDQVASSTDALIVQAVNKELAEAEALRQALEKWPEAEGWTVHLAIARLIVFQSRYAVIQESTQSEERVM